MSRIRRPGRAGNSRGPVAVGMLLALVLTLGMGLGTRPAHAQSITNILPKADCVWLLPGGWWLSVWRYKNAGPAVTIPVRTAPTPVNYFTGTGASVGPDVGQTTNFLANQTPQSSAFFVVLASSSVTSLTWNLAGNRDTLTRPTTADGGARCGSSPVPMVLGGGTATTTLAMAATMGLTAAVLVRRRRPPRVVAGPVIGRG